MERTDKTSKEAPSTPKLNTREAAAYLRLGVSSLYKMRMGTRGPAYFKLGSRVVYDVADLESWLADRRRTSTSDGDGQ